jgi:hypothetical protein
MARPRFGLLAQVERLALRLAGIAFGCLRSARRAPAAVRERGPRHCKGHRRRLHKAAA